MKIRRKYLPLIPKYFNTTNDDIAKHGLQKAMRNILLKTQTKIITNNLNEKLKRILKNNSVILVCNHPDVIEPVVLLASLPRRNDVFVVASDKFLNFLSNLNKHIIPVYIQHHYGKINRLSFRARLFNCLSLSDQQLDNETAHQKNIQSIKIASQKIDKGSMVIIFPGNENKKWFSGVGHMLKGIKTQNNIYFVKSYIQETTKVDLLRILPIITKLFPTISIHFDKPYKVNHLRKYDGKKIAEIFEKQYRDWVKTLLK